MGLAGILDVSILENLYLDLAAAYNTGQSSLGYGVNIYVKDRLESVETNLIILNHLWFSGEGVDLSYNYNFKFNSLFLKTLDYLARAEEVMHR
jgi:hypothetical protein